MSNEASPRWPDGKKFAFTVVDDTDNSFVDNVKPVYELLYEAGLRTTKTVWVYPPRDSFTGYSLHDPDYLDFVRTLVRRGFEIASHGVGSGRFERKEILEGYAQYKSLLGESPKMHINHASNPDNLYWGWKRHPWPFSFIHKMRKRDRRSTGESPSSPLFWGDYAKGHIKYFRNYTFNGINTLSYDPMMPYRVKRKERFSNYWFSSSDGHTVEEFRALLSRQNIDQLVREGGLCIVYTHFASGFVGASGKVDEEFEAGIRYLAEQPGWFAPASEILDYLVKQGHGSEPRYWYQVRLYMRWLWDRIAKKRRYGR